MEKRSKIFIVIAVIYWLLPDLMPGVPVDDIFVAIICALANKKLGVETHQNFIEE